MSHYRRLFCGAEAGDANEGGPGGICMSLHASMRPILAISIHDHIESIERGEYFSTIKLCHGFWEHVVRLERLLEPDENADLRSVDAKRLQSAIEQIGARWPADLFLDLLDILNSQVGHAGLCALVSPFGWPNALEIEGTPVVGLPAVHQAFERYIPPSVPLYDGLVWKKSVHDGSFADFVNAIRPRPVVVAAPDYARDFVLCAGLENVRFVPAHPSRAAWDRHRLLEDIGDAARSLGSAGVVTLIEAGGVTSSWLCAELAKAHPQSFHLAPGQVLNLFSVEQLRKTNWFCVYGRRILDTSRKIYPGTDELWRKHVSKTENATPFRRPIDSVTRRDFALNELVSRAVSESENRRTESPISFIEQKRVDERLFSELLSLSDRANHFANFGPVSRLLEEAIKELLALPAGKEVVLCKSATSALHVLAATHEYRLQRPMKWVVSAFGFYSTAIDAFADSVILDCDKQGMLDVAGLEALADEDWDGAVVTNIFGLSPDMQDYVDLCYAKGKSLIVDNATALFCDARLNSGGFPGEVVSFHHTKPWGMGEGGCLILDTEHAEIARALTNFGVGLDHPMARYRARNAKLADYDSALILQRLINMPRWADRYRMQARRIDKLAKSAGLKPLASVPKDSLIGSLPCLSENEITKDQLNNPRIVLRKYYKPLSGYAPRAEELYRRIVNIPCHPDVVDCPDDALVEMLTGLNGGV